MNTISIEKQGYRLLENASLRRKGKKPLNAQKLNKKWEKKQISARNNTSLPFPDRIIINEFTFDMNIQVMKNLLDAEGIEYLEIKNIDFEDIDDYTCLCGNTSYDSGFFPCNENGENCEPSTGWKELYKCGKCGEVHRIKR